MVQARITFGPANSASLRAFPCIAVHGPAIVLRARRRAGAGDGCMGARTETLVAHGRRWARGVSAAFRPTRRPRPPAEVEVQIVRNKYALLFYSFRQEFVTVYGGKINNILSV
jgi:hypothetical protein